ncbi:MAG: hypothetical protein LBC08_04860 [Campylobacteraceae bacterium]|nr:hypothetical protein [Campylobacteraceae bacterium]
MILFFISISYFIILISLNYISDFHFKLSEQEIKELHISAENSNTTAVKKLLNYYYFIEKDHDKVFNVYRKYKDVNPKVKKALCSFLSDHKCIGEEHECSDLLNSCSKR